MITLKPCPFCGGTNLASPPGQAVIVCGDCDATGPAGAEHPTSEALTYIAGASKWNQRDGDPVPPVMTQAERVFRSTVHDTMDELLPKEAKDA
ncbi:unnamed protein product [marine sediment metagenome]|uniref:Restriction alleviation protein, Lar family n=1 Tax=marine sediment metagenome TaxID=412755 RepID=X0TF40_9ZZZZ